MNGAPWEQQEDESDEDFARFAAWLGMPDRRGRIAAAALGISHDTVRRISSAHDWRARAGAYDKDAALDALATTRRARLDAATTAALALAEGLNALRDTDPSTRATVKDVRDLAATLRSILGLDVFVSTEDDQPGIDRDLIAEAIRLSQELEREREEHERELYPRPRPQRPAIEPPAPAPAEPEPDPEPRPTRPRFNLIAARKELLGE